MKEKDYYGKLSDASKKTLLFQGGPMNQSDLKLFELSQNFDVILKMRSWDDFAKDTKLNLSIKSKELIEKYKIMLSDLISLKKT